MSRASRADAAKHREEVVSAAARLFRERGTAVSLQEVTAAAGLTHGGFYKQFASKDELTGIAAGTAFGALQAHVDQLSAQAGDPAKARSHVLRDYLSAEHRDSPGTGCAGTGFASDSARAEPDSALRQTYIAGVKQMVEMLEALDQEPGASSNDVRRRAVFDLSAMVGALTLARATVGDPIADEILMVIRETLDAGQPAGGAAA